MGKLAELPVEHQFLILRERYRALKQEVRHLRQENSMLRRTAAAPPDLSGLNVNQAMERLFAEVPLAEGQEHEWLTPAVPAWAEKDEDGQG